LSGKIVGVPDGI